MGLGHDFFVGRLGNQMSSYATLLAFEKMYGLKPYLTKDQKEMLNYYFEGVSMDTLEVQIPSYYR